MTRPIGIAFAVIALNCAPALAQDPSTRPGSVFPTDWAERDFEGRWYTYSKAMERDRSAHADWLVALRDAREYAILEWIALTEPGFLAGEVLVKADAPNWIRCAAFAALSSRRLPQLDSHGHNLAWKILKEDKSGVVSAWFVLHPMPGWDSSQTPTPDATTRAAAYLPPLEANDLLSGLDPPEKVLEFGARTRAVAGEFYLHQVRRSLAVLSFGGPLQSGLWLPRVAALLRHPDPAVRRDTLLAYTMINPVVVPVATILAVARNAGETPAIREAAVLALSFAFHSPTAWAEVQRVADDPRHPGFKAAVSRLGDVGDGFSSERLVFVVDRAGPDAALVREVRDRIAKREAEESYGTTLDEAKVKAMLLRAAHLKMTVDPMAPVYSTWMTQALANDRRQASVRALVDRLAGTFTAPADVEMDGFAANGTRIPVSADEVTASGQALAASIVVELATKPR